MGEERSGERRARGTGERRGREEEEDRPHFVLGGCEVCGWPDICEVMAQVSFVGLLTE